MQAKVVHDVCCKHCNSEKIVGVRYKCTQRSDFNICETCEEKLGPDCEYSFIKIRKPEMAPLHLVCQYGNKIPEGFEIELRHAPVQKEQNLLIEKMENSQVDKSEISFGDAPVVQPPSENLAVSELSKSTMTQIDFMNQVDLLNGEKERYKCNMISLMQMGMTNFELCLRAL